MTLLRKLLECLGLVHIDNTLESSLRKINERLDNLDKRESDQDRELALAKRRADRIEMSVRSLRAQVDAKTGYIHRGGVREAKTNGDVSGY